MTAKSDGRIERLCSKSSKGKRPTHAARDAMASKMRISDCEAADKALVKRITCTATKATASVCRLVSSQLDHLSAALHRSACRRRCLSGERTNLTWPLCWGTSLGAVLWRLDTRNGRVTTKSMEDKLEMRLSNCVGYMINWSTAIIQMSLMSDKRGSKTNCLEGRRLENRERAASLIRRCG